MRNALFAVGLVALSADGILAADILPYPNAPRFLTPATVGIVDYNPVFSPDGKLIVFSRSIGKGAAKLYIVPASGGDPKQLIQGPAPADQSRPSWSVSTGKIAFTGCGGDLNGKPICRIWVANEDGTSAHPIALREEATSIYYPSWFPDGKHLAVLDADQLVIRRVSVTTGETTNLTDPSKVLTGMPAVSPDGKLVAFAGQQNEGRPYNQARNRIWLLENDGAVKPLEAEPAQGRAPAWSPDGQKIAFESVRRGTKHNTIFAIDRHGMGLIQITTSDLPSDHASWSPDGRHITFAYQMPSAPNAWGIGIVAAP